MKRTTQKRKPATTYSLRVLSAFTPALNVALFLACASNADTPPNGALALSAKPKTVTGTWHLNQTCAVLGDQDVFVSDKGIKIVDRSVNLTTVASSPDWIVTTYDTRSKTYSQVPLKAQRTYIPDKEFKVIGTRWQNLALEKEPQSTDVAKIPSQGYVTPSSFSEKQLKDRESESADMQFVVSAKHCEATNLSVPKEAARVLSTYYALPNKGGVPLQFRYHDLGGYFHNWLVTSNVEPVAAIDYKPPIASGFQKLGTAFDIKEAAQKSARAKETKKKVPLL